MKLYYCNICDNKINKFIPITKELGEKLKNYNFKYDINDFETLNHSGYSCPECGSSDRDRLMYAYIKTIDDIKDKKILEFAPSNSFSNKINGLTKTGNHKTADLYIKNVDIKVDICDMKIIKSNSFDIIICSHILEHVKDDKKALLELKRILSKDGVLLLLVPIIDKDVFDEDINEKNPDERWRRFAQDDHLRLYSKNEFIKRIDESTLKLQQITPKDTRLNLPKLNGIDAKSILYVCTK